MIIQPIMNRYATLLFSLILLPVLPAQSIIDFVGEWSGTESLMSQVEQYEDKDILVNISEGGNRKGFLIYESSSNVVYNKDLSWSYHYFDFSKENGQVSFLKRYITPIGVLGSQELIYSIQKLTDNLLTISHVSNDGTLAHKMILNREVLGIDNHIQPGLISLKPNYPNPFNPVTTITVDIKNESFGDLSIFNTQGQLVNTLYSGSFHSGQSTYRWYGIDNSGNPVNSGAYFYRLRVSDKVISRKMVLIK